MALAPSRVTVFVHHARIASMTLWGGEVWDFNREVTRRVMAKAIEFAPVGKPDGGTLKASHEMSNVPAGPDRVQGNVKNTAPHAMWVHEGTLDKAPIRSPYGNRLRYFYDNQVRFSWSVAGQQSNPWLADALTFVMREIR